jgi:hypothetical protein
MFYSSFGLLCSLLPNPEKRELFGQTSREYYRYSPVFLVLLDTNLGLFTWLNVDKLYQFSG